MTRCGAVSQKANEFELFLRDLGKLPSLVGAMHARIHCNEWRVGH